LYVIEGERVVRRALAAGVEIEQVLMADDVSRSAALRPLLDALAERGVQVDRAPSAALKELSEGRNSGAVLALAKLPAIKTLQDWWRSRTTTSTQEVLLVLVNVREPGNVGALTRTALASGVGALVTWGETDPFHPKAVRSSLGSVFKVQHYVANDLTELTSFLRASRVQQIAAVAEGGVPLPQAHFKQPLAVYVGNETQGLPAEVLASVDERVTIPMPAGVDSFSVNAATAIVLYEVSQRRYEHSS
jgi:TrmH family RNA methyltransferase